MVSRKTTILNLFISDCVKKYHTLLIYCKIFEMLIRKVFTVRCFSLSSFPDSKLCVFSFNIRKNLKQTNIVIHSNY